MAEFKRFVNKVNRFAEADDIYLTKNSIAVRNVSTYQDKNGNSLQTFN